LQPQAAQADPSVRDIVLMLVGQPRRTKDLAASGLFDAAVVDEVVAATPHLALELAGAGVPFPRRPRSPFAV